MSRRPSFRSHERAPRLAVTVAVALVVALVATLGACGGKSALDTSTSAATQPPPKDAITKTTENGPVKVTLSVWPPMPSLGDPIYLRLDVEAPAGIHVDAPFQEAGDQRMGRFRVVGFSRDTAHADHGGTHQRQTYTLEAPTSGKHRIPPLRLEMIDARGAGHTPAPSTGAGSGSAASRPQEILTEEVPLDVAPVPAEAIGAKLRAAAGTLDPDVGGTPWALIVGIVGALAVLGSGSVLVLRALRARRRLANQRSAYDEAIAKLRTLEHRGAPTAEIADAWFVELSAIIRSYLERRYEIRAPELTTEEFLQEASRARELTAEHRAQLSAFLERCDRVKFAGYRPDTQESIDTLAAARAFVEETRLRDEPARPATRAPREAA